MKSAGSAEFDRRIPSLVDAAERFGVSVSLISKWRKGERKPTEAARIAIEEAYGIDRGLWECQPGPPPAAAGPPTPQPAAPSSDGGNLADVAARNLENAQRLTRHVTAALGELAGEKDAGRKARIGKDLADMIVRVGKLTGASELTEAQILGSPAWRRIAERIVAALEPHPEACRAVLLAFEGGE